jgi:hypothetical protein
MKPGKQRVRKKGRHARFFTKEDASVMKIPQYFDQKEKCIMKNPDWWNIPSSQPIQPIQPIQPVQPVGQSPATQPSDNVTSSQNDRRTLFLSVDELDKLAGLHFFRQSSALAELFSSRVVAAFHHFR